MGSGQKLGATIVLKVISGHVVDIAVKSFYKSGGTANSPNSSVTDALSSFANGIVATAINPNNKKLIITEKTGLGKWMIGKFRYDKHLFEDSPIPKPKDHPSSQTNTM